MSAIKSRQNPLILHDRKHLDKSDKFESILVLDDPDDHQFDSGASLRLFYY